MSEPRRERLPIILQLTADDFAVAVWPRDEDGDLFGAFPVRGGREGRLTFHRWVTREDAAVELAVEQLRRRN